MLSTDPPLVKPAGPEEIAQAAVYLASGDSKGITGMEVLVDGGMALVPRLRSALETRRH
jgi:enoyl-[acyl-carrier-protein] reductase (NADH)